MIIGGGGTGTSIGNSNTFLGLLMDGSNTTESLVQQVVPVAGTLSDFNIRTDGNPGTGDSWTFTVRADGANSTVTCPISGSTATSCSDVTHSATIPAGSLLSIGVAKGGSPTGRTAHWTAKLTP
jgi:hypothetical protein